MQIPTENGELIEFNQRLVDVLRGKSLTYPQEVSNEIRVLCRIIDWFEANLDEVEKDDRFGTEGWRREFGVVED